MFNEHRPDPEVPATVPGILMYGEHTAENLYAKLGSIRENLVELLNQGGEVGVLIESPELRDETIPFLEAQLNPTMPKDRIRLYAAMHHASRASELLRTGKISAPSRYYPSKGENLIRKPLYSDEESQITAALRTAKRAVKQIERGIIVPPQESTIVFNYAYANLIDELSEEYPGQIRLMFEAYDQDTSLTVGSGFISKGAYIARYVEHNHNQIPNDSSAKIYQDVTDHLSRILERDKACAEQVTRFLTEGTEGTEGTARTIFTFFGALHSNMPSFLPGNLGNPRVILQDSTIDTGAIGKLLELMTGIKVTTPDVPIGPQSLPFVLLQAALIRYN